MSHIQIGWTEYPPEQARGGALTIGNFDGVHEGHRALVAGAKRWSEKVGGPCVVVTFDPPPQAVLNPDPTKQPLTTLQQRAALLHEAGADHVVTINTVPGLLAISPEAFFEDVLVRQLGAKAIIEGADFRFGRKRSGDIELLKRLCRANEMQCDVVTPVLIAGEIVSSSRIRNALLAGRVNDASELLGRLFSIRGTQRKGHLPPSPHRLPPAQALGADCDSRCRQ